MNNYIIHMNKHEKTETLSHLEQTIQHFNSFEDAASEHAYIDVLEALQNCICHHDNVVVPVELPKSFLTAIEQADIKSGDSFQLPDALRLTLRTIESNEDNYVFAAFTNREKVMQQEASSTTTIRLDSLLQRALFDPLIDGVLINPWNDSFFLPKELIRDIFHDTLSNMQSAAIAPSGMDNTNTETAKQNHSLEEAIQFAMDAHKGATRKGSNLPYILHPLETMQILASMDADINLMIAGVLHDTIEDTDTTLNDIYNRFGADVANLVNGHTEDKDQIWYIRKLTTIEALPHETIRQKMLTLADKLANMRSMYKDLKQLGDKLWERFNAPKEFQSWNYSKLCDGLEDLKNYKETADAYWELTNLFKDIFVTYYIDEKRGLLHQISTDNEHYVLRKGDPMWHLAKNCPSIEAHIISRKEAEYIEDQWAEEQNYSH